MCGNEMKSGRDAAMIGLRTFQKGNEKSFETSFQIANFEYCEASCKQDEDGDAISRFKTS